MVSLDIADVVRDISRTPEDARGLQQADRAVDRCGTEVHVPLGRDQILVAREFLNGSGWRAAHRQMGTEGVAEHMDPVPDISSPRCAFHTVLNLLSRERTPVVLTEHPGTPEMSRLTERDRQADR
jgi:hypothetical protein